MVQNGFPHNKFNGMTYITGSTWFLYLMNKLDMLRMHFPSEEYNTHLCGLTQWKEKLFRKCNEVKWKEGSSFFIAEATYAGN